MGLDTTHNAWHGSYSGFAEWRKWLAEQIGINLDAMDGFQSSFKQTPKKIIKWESLPHDDLHYLLNHSDCDGSITSKRCGKIAKRLDQILKKVKPNKNIVLDYESEWKVQATKDFSKGCKKAFKLKQNIQFH